MDIIKDIAALAVAGAHAQEPNVGEAFATLPSGYTLASLEKFRERPDRIRGLAALDDLQSFCAYVNEQKKDSRIFVNRVTGAAICYLDFHVEQADWLDHVATWTPLAAPAWEYWNRNNGKPLSQQQFAEFAEDRLRDFENPTGGEMFDIITTLTATGQLNFSRATRLDNNTVKLTYEETIDTKAGQKGELTVPQIFALGIDLFPGLGTSAVQARLRYRIQNGELTFTYKLIDTEALWRKAVDSIVETISKATGLPVFMGKFTKST